MAMTYNQLLVYLENLLVDAAPSTDFTSILPAAIQYSEDRIYRELDLLSTRTSDTSVALTPSSRNATCPSAINVVEGISLLTPVGNTPPTAARSVLERASLDFIDFTYGASEASTGTPLYFAMKSATGIVFAPTPASAWKIEITGTAQPTAMSLSNQTTYLGNNYPDLLLAGCMVFLTGWQQNFGASSDNPQMAMSWETQYNKLFSSANEEVQRQKSQDPNWTPFAPTSLSEPRK